VLLSSQKDISGIGQVKTLFMEKARQSELAIAIPIKFATTSAYHSHTHLTKAKETRFCLLTATHTAFLN
jgi:hypothetical protein